MYKLTDTLQPILQLRKLRFRKMKPFVQDHLWEASNPRDLRPLTHTIYHCPLLSFLSQLLTKPCLFCLLEVLNPSPPLQPTALVLLQAPPHTCVLILASSLVLRLIPASFPITLSLAARGVSLKHKTVLEFLMAKTCQGSPVLSREDLNLVWSCSLQNLVPAQPLSSRLLF